MNLQNLLFTALLLHLSTGAPSLPIQLPYDQSSIRPLHIFPNGTAAENLFVREDNSILMTTIYPSALLYFFSSPTSPPVLLYNFTAVSMDVAAYGITEWSPDRFAVVTGTFDRSGNVTNATGNIWDVDLTQRSNTDLNTTNSSDSVTPIVTLHDIGFLNGATTLDPSTLLVADSVKGVVYAVDPQGGTFTMALNDTSLQPNATGPVRLGVNGLQFLNDTLYFTNTNKRTVGKVELSVENGTVSASGPYELVASNVYVDDLEVDDSGNVYLPALTRNEITAVLVNQQNETMGDPQVRVLAGGLNSTDVPGPTALKFAKSGKENMTTKVGEDRCTERRLLIATSGGIEHPINGTFYMGGGLYELDLGHDCS